MIRPGLFAIAVALWLTSCASTPEAEETARPQVHGYKVMILPVTCSENALAPEGEEDDIPISVTCGEMCTRIRNGIVEAGVFSATASLDQDALKTEPGQEVVDLIEREARRHRADLVLRVVVRSARITDLGTNDNTTWSVLSWLFVPFLWTLDDRTYATEFAAQAELFAADNLERPIASFVASSSPQTLDLYDRGIEIAVVVVPPPYLTGDEDRVSETLTEAAILAVTEGLVDELSRREIPTRFQLDVDPSGEHLLIRAVTRRNLRSIELLVDDESTALWGETGLMPEKDTDPATGGFVYERRVKIDGLATRRVTVRVIAEDEVGGREVRTLSLGAGR